MEQDTRNHGLRRIYFFKRKSNGEIIAIDAELQAHHQLRKKNFQQDFEYLGWTDGKQHTEAFKALEKELRDQALQEAREMKLFGEQQNQFMYTRMADLTKQSQDRVTKLLEEEAERAINNPDKTAPRDFRGVDLNGNPANPMIAGFMGMMRR